MASAPPLLLLLCLSASLHHTVDARSVFAHYMLWAPSSTDNLDGFRSEISYAKSKGIDAFALNTNEWNQDIYKRRALQIYQAAQEIGGFKIFFSLDMHHDARRLTASDVIDMISTFSNHPAQYFYNGKQLVTTWVGDDDRTFESDGFNNALDGWSQAVFNRLPGGRSNYFFIPFFPTGGSQAEVANKISTWNSLIDGLFAWDTSAWPYFNNDFNNPSNSKDLNYLAACNNAGKVYMAAVSPWFFKHVNCCNGVCRPDKTEKVECGCQVKGNYQGPMLWIKRWEQLIRDAPPLVEIITWNDWVEKSYVAPIQNPAWGPQENNDMDFSHKAFMELGSYYFNWYKTGSKPAVTQETVFIFYYTQSKTANARNDPCKPQNVASLDDRVYVATRLKSAAQVVIQSGGSSSQTFNAQGGGIEVFSMPFREGQQIGTVRRNNAQLLQIVGNKPVSNSFDTYDFNVYTGFTSKVSSTNVIQCVV